MSGIAVPTDPNNLYIFVTDIFPRIAAISKVIIHFVVVVMMQPARSNNVKLI